MDERNDLLQLWVQLNFQIPQGFLDRLREIEDGSEEAEERKNALFDEVPEGNREILRRNPKKLRHWLWKVRELF